MHNAQIESDSAFSLRNLMDLEAQRNPPASETEAPATVRDTPEERIKHLEEEVRQLHTALELKDGIIKTLQDELAEAANDAEPATEKRRLPLDAIEDALDGDEQPFTSLHHGFLNVAV